MRQVATKGKNPDFQATDTCYRCALSTYFSSQVIPADLKPSPMPRHDGDAIDTLRIADQEEPSLLACSDNGLIAVPEASAV